MEIEWPEAYADMFRASFGVDQWRLYCETFHSPPERGVRTNSPKAGGAVIHALQEADLLRDPVPWSADSYYIPLDAPVGADPLHAAGCVYLQEPSAMAVAAALDPAEGERILDLCAAPGSKTTQIAALMNNSALLIANEINPERCQILAENTERMGLRSTTVTQAKPESLAVLFPQFFSGVLVDAPCSGEGMFRKDVNARACWKPDLPLANARRQLDILEAAYETLAPGGRIVYSTCTFNPVENEGVVLRFLARHPELALAELKLPKSAPGITLKELQTIRTSYQPLDLWLQPIDDWLNALERANWFGNAEHSRDTDGSRNHDGYPKTRQNNAFSTQEICDTSLCARYFPHHARGEGHFMAILRHQGKRQPAVQANDNKELERHRRKSTPIRSAHSPLAALFREFANHTLSGNFLHYLEDSYTLWPQGDLLFAVSHELANHLATMTATPKQHPALATRQSHSRLRNAETSPAYSPLFLRMGLPLVQMSQRHVVPTHSLALALRPDDSLHPLRFEYGDPAVLAYLKGETITLPPATPPGWTLVTIAGAAIGWGKVSDGVLKNHYPKGLRRTYRFAAP